MKLASETSTTLTKRSCLFHPYVTNTNFQPALLGGSFYFWRDTVNRRYSAVFDPGSEMYGIHGLIKKKMRMFQDYCGRNRAGRDCVLLRTDILCIHLLLNRNKNSQNFPKIMRPRIGLLKSSSPEQYLCVLQQTAILRTTNFSDLQSLTASF